MTTRTLATRGAALTGALLMVALPVAPVAAQEVSDTTSETNPNRYSLSATAEGMAFEIQNGKIPANIVVSASPVSSFASVDSTGNSRAFAGLPYFGPSVQTLPGTVNGLSGGATPPIPPIPGYVESRFPGDPDRKESQGPYVIRANSTETASRASAGAGLSGNADEQQPQVFSSSAAVANPDGSVISTATAGVSALNIGPLSVLNFTTKETITEAGDGSAPKITSSASLGTLQVGGFTLGIDQNGFNVLGSPFAVPAADALEAVNEMLADAQMEVSYLPRSVTKDEVNAVTTVRSGALRITTLQDVPAQGPTRVIYTYGKVLVSSSDVPFEDFGGEDTPVVDLPVGGGEAVPPPVVDSGGVGVSEPPALSAGDPVLDAAPLPAEDVAPPAVADSPTQDVIAAPPASGGQPTTNLGFVPTSAPRGDGALIYLVLVLGGAAVVAGQQLFSRFGIQLLLRA